MSRKRRNLRPDEAELWKQVAETAIPLQPVKKTATIKSAPAKPKPPREDIRPFTMGERSRPSAPALPQPPPDNQVLMDRKSFTRLKRGKLSPDARIDLHGMTVAQAHPALTQFILSSHARGARLVLVITGKGRAQGGNEFRESPRGILRHQVPQWLRHGPTAHAVLQITPAHIKHGGEGAYYVYLRRSR